MNRRLLGSAMACALAAGLVACGSSSSTKPVASDSAVGPVMTPAAKGDVDSVTWALASEPTSLDWERFNDSQQEVLANVCERLMQLQPDLTTKPGLATKVSHPDAKTSVYDLRSGVTFHDGTTMTADDVVASLRRNMSPTSLNYSPDYAAIEKTGPLQVTVRLTRPNVTINEEFAGAAGTIESARFLAKAGKAYGTPTGGIDCTGPYQLTGWQPGRDITIKRAANYWDTQRPIHTGNVRFVFVPDPAARVSGLQTGQLDGTYRVPVSGIDRLKAASGGNFYLGKTLSTNIVYVVSTDGPLADPRIRRALSLAIDRKGLIRSAYAGIGTPARSPVPPDAFGYAKGVYQSAYDALPFGDQDLAAARRLVQEAGAPQDPIVFATSSVDPSYLVVANHLQAIGKQIGLNIKIKSYPANNYLALFYDPGARAGISLAVYTGQLSVPEPLEYWQNLLPGAILNLTGYDNPGYSARIKQAVGVDDPTKRADLTAKAQRQILDDGIMIPIAVIPETLYLNQRVTGAPTTTAYTAYPWAADLGSSG